jgi:hypothetical protein
MILVDIYVPSVDQAFDFLLDENAEVSSIMADVTEMIAKKTGSKSADGASQFVLYKSDSEQPLNAALSLFENGIGDGDRLILV